MSEDDILVPLYDEAEQTGEYVAPLRRNNEAMPDDFTYSQRGFNMKGKVIKVSQSSATIGWPDGSFKTVSYRELGFCPEIGEELELYTNGHEVTYVQSNARTNTNGKKAVNQIVYALVAIFLGGFGVHKFYAGKIGLGILYFLFTWSFVPWLLGIIEGIVAFTKKTDSDGNIYL